MTSSSGFRGGQLLKAAVAALAIAAAYAGAALSGPVLSSPTGPSAENQYGPRRVTICHKTGRRARPYTTITVAQSRVRAHLRHGDTTGSCATRLNGAVSTRVTLTNSAGRRVTSIRRGAYWVVVSDRSRTANFRLRGPRVNRSTTARFVGTAKWRVRFLRGTYRYRADSGASGGGSFRVR